MNSYDKAIHARNQYRLGNITRSEALAMMDEYISEFNVKARELAKKYKQRPRLFNFASFVR